jgi:molecular chaperone DnaK (HSP70)
MMENWTGIDFGTSSSAVAVIRNRQPELATPSDSDAVGSKIFPTAVYVDTNGNVSACHDAERMKYFDCSRFLCEFKPDIHDGTIPDLGVGYTTLVAAVLKTLKSAAEKASDKPVENVVLTVPATYHESGAKQQVMLAAARDAGFRKVEIIGEAQAAAVCYDFMEQRTQGYSLIYDLGGGTFDAAVIRHTDSDYRLVGNPAGSPKIGGKFFTQEITNDYLKQTGIEIDWNNPKLSDEIQTKCEAIKRHLSNAERGEFPVSQGKSYTLTRKAFENMISEKLDKTLDICNALLNNVNLEWKDMTRVLLVGGSCNIPLVRSKLESHLTSLGAGNTHVVWKRTESDRAIDPQFAVAMGAAVYAMKKYMILPPLPPQIIVGVLKNSRTGQVYRLKEGRNIFGRAGDVDFSFPDDARMSRKHFAIDVSKNGGKYDYLITDLGSSHGTVVGNMVLTNQYAVAEQSAPLAGGEKIVAGNTKLEFII